MLGLVGKVEVAQPEKERNAPPPHEIVRGVQILSKIEKAQLGQELLI